MTEDTIFTKKIAKSGRGYLVWIPKDVSDFLDIDEQSYVEIKIKKLNQCKIKDHK